METLSKKYYTFTVDDIKKRHLTLFTYAERHQLAL